jgi:cell division control protein 45
MLDCGATVDLAELLSVSPEMTIYLLDSHRPYSLFNIFSNSQLVIFDDGFIEENLADLEQAFEATKVIAF